MAGGKITGPSMQNAARAAGYPAICPMGPDAAARPATRETGKLLGPKAPFPPAARWHVFGEGRGMILPLLAFFTLATLLCAVVRADSADSSAPATRETRPGFPRGVEPPPNPRVGSTGTPAALPAAGELKTRPGGSSG
jgi:hypothetical protein